MALLTARASGSLEMDALAGLAGFRTVVAEGAMELAGSADAMRAAALPAARAPTAMIDPVPPGAEGTTATLSATLASVGVHDEIVRVWSVSAGTLDDLAADTPVWTRPAVDADAEVRISLTIHVLGTGTLAAAGSTDERPIRSVTAVVTAAPAASPLADGSLRTIEMSATDADGNDRSAELAEVRVGDRCTLRVGEVQWYEYRVDAVRAAPEDGAYDYAFDVSFRGKDERGGSDYPAADADVRITFDRVPRAGPAGDSAYVVLPYDDLRSETRPDGAGEYAFRSAAVENGYDDPTWAQVRDLPLRGSVHPRGSSLSFSVLDADGVDRTAVHRRIVALSTVTYWISAGRWISWRVADAEISANGRRCVVWLGPRVAYDESDGTGPPVDGRIEIRLFLVPIVDGGGGSTATAYTRNADAPTALSAFESPASRALLDSDLTAAVPRPSNLASGVFLAVPAGTDQVWASRLEGTAGGAETHWTPGAWAKVHAVNLGPSLTETVYARSAGAPDRLAAFASSPKTRPLREADLTGASLSRPAGTDPLYAARLEGAPRADDILWTPGAWVPVPPGIAADDTLFTVAGGT